MYRLRLLSNRKRVDVRGDQYPYLAGSTFLAALLPPDALEGGFERVRAADILVPIPTAPLGTYPLP